MAEIFIRFTLLDKELQTVLVVRAIFEPLQENLIGLEFQYDIFLLCVQLFLDQAFDKVKGDRVNVIFFFLFIQDSDVCFKQFELVFIIKLRTESCNVP
jgi:hypothetical protein